MADEDKKMPAVSSISIGGAKEGGEIEEAASATSTRIEKENAKLQLAPGAHSQNRKGSTAASSEERIAKENAKMKDANKLKLAPGVAEIAPGAAAVTAGSEAARREGTKAKSFSQATIVSNITNRNDRGVNKKDPSIMEQSQRNAMSESSTSNQFSHLLTAELVDNDVAK